MSKKKKERNTEPESTQEETVFRVPEKPTDGSSIVDTLANDGQFRKFFTTSVIEIPEDMRKADADLYEIEDDEPRKKRGPFWFLSRKNGANKAAEPQAPDVRIPELAQGQAEETLAAMEPAEATRDKTGEIRLTEPETQEAARAEKKEIVPAVKPMEPVNAVETAKPAEPKKPAEPAKAVEAVEPAEPAKPAEIAKPDEQAKPAESVKPVASLKPVEAAKPAETAKPDGKPVDIFSLLEQIKEAQAVMGAGIVPGMAQAAADTLAQDEMLPASAQDASAEEASAAEPDTTDTAQAEPEKPAENAAAAHAESARPTQMLRPDAQELAETEPQDIDEEPAETNSVDLLDEAAPEQPAAGEEPTGTISFVENEPEEDEEACDSEIDADQAPTGEIALSGEEPVGEEPLSGAEPTGEISLAADEPTGEVSLAGQELTGEIPLAEAAQAAAAEHPRWGKLLNLFAGDKEPEENAETAEGGEAQNTQEFVLPEEMPEPEYTSTEDADGIRALLQSRAAALTLRTALTGILAVLLLVLDLMGQGILPSPDMIDPAAAPAAWLGVHLILMGVCIVLTLPVLKNGILSLLPEHEASADALAVLAAAAALLQTVTALLCSNSFDPAATTMFTGAAALGLTICMLGHRFASSAVRDGFSVMTSGVDNATGYCPKEKHLTDVLCDGMDEEQPVLLLSRSGTLLKNFVAQSAAPHHSDELAVKTARILGIVAIVAAVITLAKGAGVLAGVSALAAVLCLGAPLSATLIRAVPSVLMQRAAAEVSAVIPGWPAIKQLGNVDMLHVSASELFPPMCAHLFGIKTFRKERIDLAILYATSILIESCDTLAGLFRGMIENNTAMLYPVKDLERKTGLGFIAWCDNCRIVLGTRELMESEGIALPAMDYENRYTQNGDRHVMYLAVSGELYAMFLFGYSGTKKVARTLGTLKHENIRILVSADDPTLTAERIEAAYRLRPGFVKVLNASETAALAPATAYLPASDGCLVHLPGFASMVGGLQAASGAENAENSAGTVQTVSVAIAVVLSVLLSLTGSLPRIALGAVLLYQIAWSALSVVITLTKKY